MSYALKKAVRVGKSDFVKFLLDAGERPSPSEHLLHIAVSRDDVLTASYLVSYITNINEQDDDGNTPLHLCKSEEMAKLLLRQNPQLNLLNNDEQLAHETIKDKLAALYVEAAYNKLYNRKAEDSYEDDDLKHRFNLSTISISDLTPLSDSSNSALRLSFNGKEYDASKRFMSSLASQLKFSTNIFNYFTPVEVFERIYDVNPSVKFKVTFDEKENRALGVVSEKKPLLSVEDACDVIFSDKRLLDIDYKEGVISSTFDLGKTFNIDNDSTYIQRIKLNLPVDGITTPNIYLSTLRQVCTNGMVAFVNGFKSEIILNESSGIHLKNLLNSYDNDVGFRNLKDRIRTAQYTTASVRELLNTECLIKRVMQNGVTANLLCECLENLAGDPCDIYGTTALTNIPTNVRAQLRVRCPVNTLINFLTELSTHHLEELTDKALDKINTFAGKTLLNNFDLEGIDRWTEPAKKLYLEDFSFNNAA